MLQRVQTKIGELRGFLMSEDTEDSTLVVEAVVSESELLRHKCDRAAKPLSQFENTSAQAINGRAKRVPENRPRPRAENRAGCQSLRSPYIGCEIPCHG